MLQGHVFGPLESYRGGSPPQNCTVCLSSALRTAGYRATSGAAEQREGGGGGRRGNRPPPQCTHWGGLGPCSPKMTDGIYQIGNSLVKKKKKKKKKKKNT